jgi:DNA gyrase subunit A
MTENIFSANEEVLDVNIEDSVKASYLDYSMSVIIGRALPDARDGLKPVHRRILFAMNELSLSHRAAYKKSARIVGDVIGKYHPHGDTAVYDALVRMAQTFSMRERLIDGQGNFGSVDGDGAAAMRYTEARMTALAEEILSDIEKETVDFIPNYDGSMEEPSVLPSRIPNLLLNGSSGIAVGMATNIPPHNLNELIDALIYLIDNKDATIDDMTNFVKGPDFPTGGIIFGTKGIRDAYDTGKGSIRIRGKTHIEKDKKSGKELIVVDELPYQVNKARLHKHIADLAKDKIVEGISEVRDESDRDGMRLVIELKKDAMSEIVLNNLFKHTALSTTFGVNLLAIHNKEPKVFNLLELLNLFLSHRKTIIIRRTIFELQKAKDRAHILEGLRIALDNIDEIVALIRASADANMARTGLMERFSLSEIQAQAILDMRLQRLTGLERDKIEKEYAELLAEIERLSAILKSEELLNSVIKTELVELKDKFPTKRLTEITEDYEDIDIEDLIPNEPMIVTMSHRGYIKRTILKTYEKQNRGGKGKIAVSTDDDDFIERFFVCNTHDTLMFVTNRGQLYWLKVYKIPESGRTAKGKPVVNLITIQPEEKIRAVINTTDFDESKSLVFFTRNGIIKRTNLSEYGNVRSVGVRAITLDENDELVTAQVVEPSNRQFFILTKKGMCIRFDINADADGKGGVRELGRTARGVTAIRFKVGLDEVIGANVISGDEEKLLTVSEKGFGKQTLASEYRLQSRGGKGVIAMKVTPKTGDLVGIIIADESMDLMALTAGKKLIRVDMSSIRETGRNASGVKIISIEDKDKVIDIARCLKEPDEEELLEDSSEEGSDGII